MERDVERAAPPRESDTNDLAGERMPAPEPPFNLMTGAAGAVVAVVISGLLVGGLWLIAREAPSAATDPRLAPVTSDGVTSDGVTSDGVSGDGVSGDGTMPEPAPVFVTIMPGEVPPPGVATGEAGTP